MSSSAQIVKASPHESGIEKQPITEVHIGFAAHLLGIEPGEVVRLCKTGALHARCNRHGTWRLDEAFLLRWHEANPNYGAAFRESSDVEWWSAVQVIPPELAESAACPQDSCSAHWERRRRIVPAFRLDLCRRCFLGHPLPPKAEEGESFDATLYRAPVASVQAEAVVSEKHEPVIQEAMEKERGTLAVERPETVSVSAAAQIAGCSRDTVMRWIEQGAVRAQRISSLGWWRVERISVMRYLDRVGGLPAGNGEAKDYANPANGA